MDELTRRIAGSVDRLADELVEAVRTAVRIPSVTPNYPSLDPGERDGGEARMAAFVAELYGRAGAEVDVFAVEPGRDNAVGVVRGRGGGRSLIFNGHTDVVPPGPPDAWANGDPWSGALVDGHIVGRGACDMKAGVVAQAFAAIALRDAGVELAGDLVLEAVVGEEMMEHELGTTACIQRGYVADGAVVAEPSAPPVPLAVIPVTPGVLWLEVTVEGRATHVSLRGSTMREPGGADVGVSAVDKLILVYQALRELEREWTAAKRHPLFEPGHFSIAPAVVVGGPSTGLVPFFIPDEARLDAIVVHHPDESREDVCREIVERIDGVAHADAWLREHPPRLEWRNHWPPSVVEVEHPLVRSLARAHELATGEAATIHGFAAVEDTTFLNAAGIPAISYGPGSLRDAHAVDESVSVGEVLAAACTYALVALDWCGST